MTSEDSQIQATTFHNEQHELHHKVDEWREWWSELSELGEPRFGEMHDRLQLIRNRLKDHFQHEEEAGFIHENSALKAKYQKQLKQLRSDHQQLLSDLDRMCDRLKTAEPELMTWGDAKSDFEQFLIDLDHHEQIENQLMEKWTKAKIVIT